MKNKHEYAIEWIEALIAEKYPKGSYRMGDFKMGYCCIGVCGIVTETLFNPNAGTSRESLDKVGIINASGTIQPNLKSYGHLAFANDNGISHKEIGEYLRDHCKTNFIPEVAAKIKEHFKI